jgi:hypothetical protein
MEDFEQRNINLFIVYGTGTLYPTIIRSKRMRWAGHVARMGEKRNAYRIFVGMSEGKKPLGRPRRRWVDNIKIALRWGGVVWTGLIWLRIGTSGELL